MKQFKEFCTQTSRRSPSTTVEWERRKITNLNTPKAQCQGHHLVALSCSFQQYYDVFVAGNLLLKLPWTARCFHADLVCGGNKGKAKRFSINESLINRLRCRQGLARATDIALRNVSEIRIMDGDWMLLRLLLDIFTQMIAEVRFNARTS